MKSLSSITLNTSAVVTVIIVLNYAMLPWQLTFIDLPATAYIAFFAVLLIGVLFFEKNFRIRPYFILWLLWGAVNITLSDIPEEVEPWNRFAGFLIISAMLAIGPSGEWIKIFRIKLLNFMFILITICMLISFMLYVAGVDLPWTKSNFHGIFNHSMMLGPLAGMGTIFLLSHAMYKNGKLKKLSLFLSIVSFLCCLLSGSRIAVVSMMIGIMILLFYSPWKKYILYILVLGATILCALQKDVVQNAYLENIMNKHETNMELGGLAASREYLWQILLNDIVKNPILGCGFGNMGGGVLNGGKIEPGSSWLYAWASLGIVGFALTIYLWCGTAIKMSSFCYKNSRSAMLLSLLCFCVVHMVAEGYIFSMGSGLFFMAWMILGNCIDCLEGFSVSEKELQKNTEPLNGNST